MARKARKRKTKPRGPEGRRRRIIDAALALAAERGWRRFRLADVAGRADVSMAELRAAFASKEAILAGFVRRVDDSVLAGGPADGTSARDRLFDVLMRRFDALAPDRDAVAAIVGDGVSDPAAALCRLPRMLRSMAWMLEAAGLSSSGPAGALRAKGLLVVYWGALRAWLADDSADMAKTMAALDRGLRRAETLAALLCPGPASGPGRGGDGHGDGDA